MEYKPPLEKNSKIQFRFLYCSLDAEDKWVCRRCKEKEGCESPIYSFESQKTQLVSVSRDMPEFLDKIILYQKLSQIPKIIK